MENNKFVVLRDTAEKDGHGWLFQPNDFCDGTKEFNLFTGDYTIEGFEKQIIIERKRSTGEFARNIFEPRFYDELKRMEAFEHPYLIFEFTLDDVFTFPYGSGIPRKVWPNLKVSAAKIFSAIIDYSLTFKTQIIFAGTEGQVVAEKIFKKFYERQNKKRPDR